MAVERFEELHVWREARALAGAVYRASGEGLFARDFGLRDQLRRAAVSVMSNIAEGFERYSGRDFRRFLAIAKGSAAEVRSQLHLAQDLGYLTPAAAAALRACCERISRMLARLHAAIRP